VQEGSHAIVEGIDRAECAPSVSPQSHLEYGHLSLNSSLRVQVFVCRREANYFDQRRKPVSSRIDDATRLPEVDGAGSTFPILRPCTARDFCAFNGAPDTTLLLRLA